MKVVGFSFIKNAVKYQYPIAEALRSILPLCDELVVAAGDSEDNTKEAVANVDSKVRIIDTVWDNSLKEGGKVLAIETNKAFASVGSDADWCVYIQGDEVLHEDGLDEVMNAMKKWKDNKEVDGLLFKYHHFYGSYDYAGTSSRWYKREIRVVRNDKSIYSYRDAQGFRKGNNQKLRVKPVNAYIYHYGWVRPPSVMFSKQKNFGGYYEGERDPSQQVYTGEFDYTQIDALEKFKGTHPLVMKAWIEKMNWEFEHDISRNHLKAKDRFKNLLEKVTGRRPFDHNNYKIV